MFYRRTCKFLRISLTSFCAFFTALSAWQRTVPTASVLHPGDPSSISASSSFENITNVFFCDKIYHNCNF